MRGGYMEAVSREEAKNPEKLGLEAKDVTAFSVRQVSLFFTIYVFFQVWNQINCRSLVPEVSGFHRLLENPTFLMIAGTIAVVQVLIVSIPWLGVIFKVEPLSLLDWVCIIAFTSTVLIFAEISRRIRVLLQARKPPAPAPAGGA
jgi:Ca2+-transporting ATPase